MGKFIITQRVNKEYQFKIIGKSQLKSSKISMENGIASVKSNAPEAEIVDEKL
ncbi:MAG: YegP family protein [Chryseobacterium jejuense]|uniref:YegP family protein n=1 Tax=Chryseobacterium jejuense TaxID=445960 RepID=UPI003D0E2733